MLRMRRMIIHTLRPNHVAIWSLVVFAVTSIAFFLLFVTGSMGSSHSAVASVQKDIDYSLLKDIPVFYALSQRIDDFVPRVVTTQKEHEGVGNSAVQSVVCGEESDVRCGDTSSALNSIDHEDISQETFSYVIESEFMPLLPAVYPEGNDKHLFVYGNVRVPSQEKLSVSQEKKPSLFRFFSPQTQPVIDVMVNTKNVMITPDNTVVASFYLTVEPLQQEIYIQPQSQKIRNISSTTQGARVDQTITLVSGLQKETSDGLLIFPRARSQVLFVRVVMKDFEQSGLYEFSFDSLVYEDAHQNVFYHPILDTNVRGVYRHNNNTLTLLG